MNNIYIKYLHPCKSGKIFEIPFLYKKYYLLKFFFFFFLIKI